MYQSHVHWPIKATKPKKMYIFINVLLTGELHNVRFIWEMNSTLSIAAALIIFHLNGCKLCSSALEH